MTNERGKRMLRMAAAACFAAAVLVAVGHGAASARQAFVAGGLFFAVVATL